ncbi:MAG: sulfatase [Akkermansiaceae bacterium]
MRHHIFHLFALVCMLPVFASAERSDSKPNIILVFVDDMGYADIGPFGSKVNRTPALDRMAEEGMRFTDFYVAASICSPSRAALMTGCYPLRVDLHDSSRGVFVLCPLDRKGLNPDELTIPEALKSVGYATACIGKWHLGDQDVFLPTRHGFDDYYGIPYSNDMGSGAGVEKGKKAPPLPLMRNEVVIEAPADQKTITQRYTDEACKFIRKNKDNPFFLYLPHTAVHTPLIGGDRFFGKSKNGLYGDSVEEVDWSTGELLKTVRELGLEKDTIVIFTSDNGANRLGSNAPFSGGKISIMEGGFRVPCIMWAPGKIPAGKTCGEIATTMDLLPTFAKMAGAKLPEQRVIDGKDIGALMHGEPDAKSPHEAFYYYFMSQLKAVRSGKWKLHLALDPQIIGWTGKERGKTKLKLYNLESDPAESKDVSADHPKVIKRLQNLADKARQDIGDYQRKGARTRPTILVNDNKPISVPESALRSESGKPRPKRVKTVHPGR